MSMGTAGVLCAAWLALLACAMPADAHHFVDARSAHRSGRSTEPGTVGVRKVGIVQMAFADDQAFLTTLEQARAATFDDPQGPRAFFDANSWGKLELRGRNDVTGHGDTFGPFVMPYQRDDCSGGWFSFMSRWGNDTMGQLASAGVPVDEYDYWVVLVPKTSCWPSGAAAIAYWQGSHLRLMEFAPGAAGSAPLTNAHELGHLVGSGHSNSWTCPRTDSGLDHTVTVDAPQCTHVEYGDPFTNMGRNARGGWDARRRIARGWLPPANVQEINADGTYTLRPMGTLPGADPTAAHIVLARAADGAPTSEVWLETRSHTGLDSWFAAKDAHQLAVRYYDATNGGHLVDRVDAGGSFLDSTSGLRLRLLVSDDNAAVIAVELHGGAAPPVVTPPPPPPPTPPAPAPTRPASIGMQLVKWDARHLALRITVRAAPNTTITSTVVTIDGVRQRVLRNGTIVLPARRPGVRPVLRAVRVVVRDSAQHTTTIGRRMLL
jgi:hypothetical protein